MGNALEDHQCRECGSESSHWFEKMDCQFCNREFVSGRADHRCKRCGHQWITDETCWWNEEPVCDECAEREVGKCAMCGVTAKILNAREVDGTIVCADCFDTPANVWCPKCGKSYSKGGYLRVVFRADPAGFQAATLVTHYRHDHTRSHDLAWKNRRYANKIPNYDYDDYKVKVNNRAKRQLIRAIAKHVKQGTYPSEAPITAAELVEAFARLAETDDKTVELINRVREQFGAVKN